MSSSRECLPIDYFEDLISWSAADCEIDASLIRSLTHHRHFDGPKVIVCHDMKGGYLEDRFIYGDENYRAYRFFHWSLIDTFIYFSHHFITIPPLTWINAAHTNGVSVLGTLITESEVGREICESLLESDEKVKLVCQKLVEIARFFKFEGWFINIENVVAKALVPRLLYFVETLHRDVKEVIPKGQVLWYDSVTVKGTLDWQNCLNHKNAAFFQCCDGIFLNYTWTDHNLRDTSKFAVSLGRLNDVFVGVDVFGRGMAGGGGFNTHFAIDKIRKNSLPMAIFAPGWVLETLGPDNFTANQIKFWDKLSLPLRHSPKDIPFYTNFCQGFGLSKFSRGEKVNCSPWYNLSEMKPTTRNYVDGEIWLEDAFEGGQSVRVINWNEPLLKCHFSLSIGLEVELVCKMISEESEVPMIRIKVQYQSPGSRGISLIRDEDNLIEESLFSPEPSKTAAESGWISVRFSVHPIGNAVLTAIGIERSDLMRESTLLVGALRIDFPNKTQESAINELEND